MDPTVLKCIAHAERKPSSDSELNEANSAAIMAFAIMRRKGIRLTEILDGLQHTPTVNASSAVLLQEKMALASENRTLRRTVSELEKKIVSLEARITKLVEKVEAPKAPRRLAVKVAPPEIKDGECIFDDFAASAVAAFNHKAGWVSAFAELAGVKKTVLQTWRKKGVVPANMLQFIEGLRTYEKPEHYKWRREDIDELVKLYKSYPSTPSYDDLAARMSDIVGHKLTDNALKGKVHSLRVAGRL